MKALGPYSRSHVLAKLDRRTAESQLVETVVRELTAHVGGKPDATQAMLIERVAMLTLHCALMDRKMLGEDGEGANAMSKADADKYLAWSNTISKLLKHLGPSKAVADNQPRMSIKERLALKQQLEHEVAA